MDKLNIKVNNNFNLDKVIKELSKNPLLTNIDINIDNLNSCLILVDENNNCKKCPGLANCPNTQKGYFTAYDNEKLEFVFKSCKLKQAENITNKENELIKTIYMPKTIREADLDDFNLGSEERKNAYKMVVNFITNYPNSKGLYLSGSYGTGKTYLLGCLAKELAKRNISSLLIYFPDLIRELKDSLKEDRFSNLMNLLKEIDVLMLDDLGSENMTPFVRDEILGPLLNYRMADKKPIFISSNLTIEQLANHLTITNDLLDKTKTMRLMSRISQVCNLCYIGKKVF